MTPHARILSVILAKIVSRVTPLMKIESLLLAALCAAPGLGRAAAISPLAAMNKSIAEMMVAFDKTQQCFELMNSLRADYARKKAELYSEFKGAIPIAFDDLLAQKAARINKQHKACVQQYDAMGLQLESLMMPFRTIDPKSLNIQ